jgi:L-arabinokinase
VIAAYVSGHGFGHATRSAEVLRVLRQLEPEAPIVVTSAAPAELFADVIQPPLRIRSLECDVGLVQKNALTIDEPATVERWAAFARRLPELIACEAQFLRAGHARLVLGDVPPLAFASAHVAGVPSVALANFSWDWIYRHLARREPALGAAADACAGDYRRCGLLLRLPFAGDLDAFPRVEDVPLVARRPRVSRFDARRRLGLPTSGRLALLSFGGIGLPGFDHEVLGGVRGIGFFEVADRSNGSGLPANLTRIDRGQMARAGLRYEDLVAAADVVITKPGYGIVSDAIGAGTPVVYTERGDFPEYDVLVAGMKAYVAAAHVSNADLLAGRVEAAIDVALATPAPSARPELSGAEAAARRLLSLAR